MDPLGIGKAADELTGKTLPEMVVAGNAFLDRLEKLLERLNGATITATITLPKEQS